MERHTTQHTTSVTTQLNICRHIVMRGARLLCSCLMGASKGRRHRKLLNISVAFGKRNSRAQNYCNDSSLLYALYLPLYFCQFHEETIQIIESHSFPILSYIIICRYL